MAGVHNEIVFDVNKGPTLKQMIQIYYRIRNFHGYYMAIFEDMHNTNFWRPYCSFSNKEYQILS